MNRVIHFEIHAEDPTRAVKFYETVFGWKFQKTDAPQEYYLALTGKGDGIDGAIMKRKGSAPKDQAPVNTFVCTIGTTSLDESIQKILENGGLQVVEKMAIPSVGWLAYCKDTEGNIFGVMEDDPSASSPLHQNSAGQAGQASLLKEAEEESNK